MEYAGSGCDYRALPENGGVPLEANESISRNSGKVWLTSTDQSGKFKVGDTFAVDQQTGFVTIDPNSYSTNLVSDLTPELGGDLDVLTKNIYSSLGNVYVNDTLEVNSGSAATPAITFNGDTNTGLFRVGADQLAVTTNGTERIRFDSTGQVELVSLGTAAAPAFTWTTDADTGLYSSAANTLDVTTGGTAKVRFDDTAAPLKEIFSSVYYPVVTQVDIGTDPNQVPLNGYLGTMAFQDSAGVNIGSASIGQIVGPLLVNGDIQSTSGVFIGDASSEIVLGPVWGAANLEIKAGSTTAAIFNTTTGFTTNVGGFNVSLGADSHVGTNDNYNFYIKTNNVYRWRVDTSGRLIGGGTGVAAVANGGILQLNSGITFPATQVASADPNTLDDYEEGTWTPVVFDTSGNNITSSFVQSGGSYTKIGRLVSIRCFVYADPGVATAITRISGLPFITFGGTAGYHAGTVAFFGGGYGTRANQDVTVFTGGAETQLRINGTLALNLGQSHVVIGIDFYTT
jgi:hypothetical protein